MIIDFLIWFYASFFIRMVIVFTVMMKYYHLRNGEVGIIFKSIAAVFYVLDIVYNYMLIPIFFDLPKKVDETVTNRCARYLINGNALQMGFAKIMRVILNFSDPRHL